MKKILILGGYGRAGHIIAELLAQYSETQLLIAGRTLRKAENCTARLSKEFPNTTFQAKLLDVEDQEQLAAAIKAVQLVIACVPLNYSTAQGLIEAVLRSPEAHYIDLSPGEDKLKAFREWEEDIRRQGKLFILNAGFEPGLPGVLARLAASQLTDPQNLLIEGIYRDPYIPEGGIKDILGHDEPAKVFRAGRWQQAGGLNINVAEFPHGFGKAPAIPISAPELKTLPEEYNGLQNLAYYHAGINGVSNLAMLAWQHVLKYFLPQRIGVSLFRWAIRHFTRPPYGGVIRVQAESKESKAEVVVAHDELYEATAIPVVATALLMLERPVDPSGALFMGQWVDRGRFVEKMKRMGMQVSMWPSAK